MNQSFKISPLLLLALALAAILPAAAHARCCSAGFRHASTIKRFSQLDWDRDSLSGWTERHRTKTNPRKFDTDRDGVGDGVEIRAGTDPRDSASYPSVVLSPQLSVTPPPPRSGPRETPVTPEGIPPTHSAVHPSTFPDAPTAPPTEEPSEPTPPVEEPTEPPVEEPEEPTEPTPPVEEPEEPTPPVEEPEEPTPPVEEPEEPTPPVEEPEEPTPPVEEPTEPPTPPPTGTCNQTLSAGANLSNALSSAASGSIICLHGGTYSGGRIAASATNKSNYVTLQSVHGETASIGSVLFDDARFLRFAGLKFTGGIEFVPNASHVQLIGNEITGREGIYFFGDQRIDSSVDSILIEGNNIHDIDYTGSQGPADGYGIKGIGDAHAITITGNTIKSVAGDYIQAGSAESWTVDRNTFLGPTLVGTHPQEHQDLWQIYSGGDGVTFTNNVARNTGTAESLLFQTGSYRDVEVVNNLFVNDSDGYTCQIYQASGLIFRNNTIVDSHWGCLFRDESSRAAGSGYQIDHNVFTDTEAAPDIALEGRSDSWGSYDYNVSSDGSAGGTHSLRNWSPSWVDTVDYLPQGLPFAAGYRKP